MLVKRCPKQIVESIYHSWNVVLATNSTDNGSNVLNDFRIPQEALVKLDPGVSLVPLESESVPESSLLEGVSSLPLLSMGLLDSSMGLLDSTSSVLRSSDMLTVRLSTPRAAAAVFAKAVFLLTPARACATELIPPSSVLMDIVTSTVLLRCLPSSSLSNRSPRRRPLIVMATAPSGSWEALATIFAKLFAEEVSKVCVRPSRAIVCRMPRTCKVQSVSGLKLPWTQGGGPSAAMRLTEVL
mmetsp:Transcript_78416/g.162918  ORF Transcript_78416/g.162918 Transcript_78416/m.162918 type:complete len:241 (-) Transcript_78416:387-1109(-)